MIDNNYQIGDYTTLKGKEIVKIIGISEYFLDVKTKENVPLLGVRYSHIIPLHITTNLLEEIGFRLLSKKKFMLHDKYFYELKLNNGKTFSMNGVVYLKNSIWISRGYTIHKLHQLQSLIKFADHSMKLILF